MAEPDNEWSFDVSKLNPGCLFAGGLGIGALAAGGVAVFAALAAVALLLGPFFFWLSWNVMDLGEAVGIGELGFWAIVLATVFLVVDWFGKTLITAIVMLVNPDWFQAEATLQWPEPSFKHFVAVTILAALASFPHAKHGHVSGSSA